jgi:hypothetical protein
LKGSLALAFVGLSLVVPAQAGAVTYYVNQSDGDASNAGACTDPAVPCQTIQAAVDKAKATSGNTVQVLPDPAGTTDTYNEAVAVTGGQPITLIGAGRGDGGTNIERSSGVPLWLATSSTARELKATQTGTGSQALSITDSGAAFERVTASAANGIAFGGHGTVRDSLLSGQTGVYPQPGTRIVRTQIVATAVGMNSAGYDVDLIGCIVRSSGGTTGIVVDGGNVIPMNSLVRLRHVTITGFTTRVSVTSGMGDADLEAANSTFAGASGVDLSMSGSSASATLDATNVSQTRTTLAPGTPAPSKTNPIDVPPGLTADGHLAANSQLIDRGTTGGFLSGDPEDAYDVDHEPRAQGPAPDVGADEFTVPGAGGAGEGAGGDGGGGGGAGGTSLADTRGPLAVLTAARTQRVLRQRAVIVTATTDEPSLLAASGTIALPRGVAATLRLRGVNRVAPANARVRLVLRVSRSGIKKLRRAFRRKRFLTARVRVRATDAAGNTRVVTRRVRLRR